MLIRRKSITFDGAEDLDDKSSLVIQLKAYAFKGNVTVQRGIHCPLRNTAYRIGKEEESYIAKGKESVTSTFTLSTANTPPQSAGNTPPDTDDDIPKDGVFSTNSFDDEHTDNEEEVEEPKKVSQALADESWVEGMQEELLQFKLQDVWVLCDLPDGKRVIGTKWTRMKVVVIDESVQHLLPELKQFDSSWHLHSFLELYCLSDELQKCIFIRAHHRRVFCQTSIPVLKILLIHTRKLMHFYLSRRFKMKFNRRGNFTFFLGLQVKQSHVRSMIGCLMYLTASRPDIMFAVCLCARFQVTPKVSHLHAVKRIFRYLKHQPKLGLWYPKDSPFHLEAFSDSDYAGDNHDRRSTSGGCQYLGRRLVSWQCKKQTIVAISSTEAEYVAAASCCAQVLWMQNQLLDYGFNFKNTEIHIDNESTICIVRNPVLHSKTKHIQIRHHFIRDCYEQRLINVVKVHTDDNVADLLTKGFDLARFNFLVVTIGSLDALLQNLRGGYE
ncbi:hypothetical protein Tco_1540250 [Tanacetum coccineum]